MLKRQGGDAFRALMADEVARARAWYERAHGALPPEDRRAQRPGSSWPASTARSLDEIVRDGYAVLDHRIALTPLRKLWIAWRTARRAK